MNSTAEFQEEARGYYLDQFGSASKRVRRYRAILLAEEKGKYDVVEHIRTAEAERVIEVQQLTHSLVGNCEWEIVLLREASGPSARLLVEVDVNNQVRYARFQYHGWCQPWFDAPGQWNTLLTDWAAAMFELECSYCREENCRW